MTDLDQIENGVVVYYQDGYILVHDIQDGVWTERSRTWVGEYDPEKMMSIQGLEGQTLIGWKDRDKP